MFAENGHEPTDLRWVLRRRVQGYAATQRVPDDVWAGQREVVDQRRYVVGHETWVDGSIDASGAAMSLQVDGDDLVALREQWQNRAERLARHESTMQQDQRAPSPVSFVVEVDPVDRCVLGVALHVGGPIGLHACAPRVLNRTRVKNEDSA